MAFKGLALMKMTRNMEELDCRGDGAVCRAHLSLENCKLAALVPMNSPSPFLRLFQPENAAQCSPGAITGIGRLQESAGA